MHDMTAISGALTELRAKLDYDNVINDILFNAVVMAEALLHVEQETGSLRSSQLSDLVDMLTVIHHLGPRQPTAEIALTFDYRDFLRQVDEIRRALIVDAFDLKAIDRLHVATPVG